MRISLLLLSFTILLLTNACDECNANQNRELACVLSYFEYQRCSENLEDGSVVIDYCSPAHAALSSEGFRQCN